MTPAPAKAASAVLFVASLTTDSLLPCGIVIADFETEIDRWFSADIAADVDQKKIG